MHVTLTLKNCFNYSSDFLGVLVLLKFFHTCLKILHVCRLLQMSGVNCLQYGGSPFWLQWRWCSLRSGGCPGQEWWLHCISFHHCHLHCLFFLSAKYLFLFSISILRKDTCSTLHQRSANFRDIFISPPSHQEFKIWQTYLLVVMLIVMLVAMVKKLVMMKNNIQMLNPFYIHEKCWYPRIPIVVKTETQRKFRHKYKWTSWFSAAAWPSR